MYWQNKFEYINILKYNIKTKPGGYSRISTKSDIIERKKEKYFFFHFTGFSSFEIVP